jgi:glycosyltransferase involved in cell wall biosynthesis
MIQNVHKKYGSSHNIIIAQQPGKGKGDAVRKGFSLATNDILMILDADLTVPPEDLPKFYHAITTGKGEFINGSRLVYPMEGKAMRFFNMVGNKFFAYAFSFVLGQNLKDTLCGTKVLSRSHYNKLTRHRKYFGEFDPFGDFDLLFGASRLGLKIIEVPITYRDRIYGSTNISRWRHGLILLRMLVFGAARLLFL